MFPAGKREKDSFNSEGAQSQIGTVETRNCSTVCKMLSLFAAQKALNRGYRE